MLRAVLIALISCWTLTTPARACEGDKVKVTLVVILASDEGDKVDPRLKAVAAEVRKLEPALKSFRLKEMTCRSLDPGEKTTFQIIKGKSVEVIVKSGADNENRVVLAVKAPDQGEIVYRAVCGKFLPIVTRCQTRPSDTRQPRERLILAIRVEPCADD